MIKSLISKGGPVRNLHGVRIGDFNGFSEYHSVAGGVSNDELAFIEHHPFGDGVIIDVGANLGLYSLLLNKRFADRRVIAFEPNPSTFSALKKNILRNGANHVECHQNAIADHNGCAMFSVREDARANASISDDVTQASAGEIRVSCTTLDTFCAEHAVSRIALLKIDVEGYETAVFKGAGRVLQKIRPSVIFFEVCPQLAVSRGFDPAEPARKLVESGYRLFQIKPAAALVSADLSTIADVSSENWLALPQ